MCLHSPHPAARLPRALLAITLGIATAACGGGGDEAGDVQSTSSAKAAHEAAAPRTVMVEGCVVDRHYIPTTGTPVRALGADGRLLGNAQSDGQGRFTLRLPSRSAVTLQIDRPQGESLPLRVGTSAPKPASCLVDELA